jgi:hypothetical protein
MKVAYQIADEESQKIFFSTPETLSDDLLDSGYEAELRTPEYDQYAILGYVPPSVLINDGWWLRCFECDEQIDSDSEKYVAEGKRIFCCSECHEINHEHREAMRQTEQRLSSFLLQTFPGISDIFVYQDHEGICAKFKFPGGERYATWHGARNSISYLAQDEKAAIAYFFSRRFVKAC